jgi:hypothetical protein
MRLSNRWTGSLSTSRWGFNFFILGFDVEIGV